MLNRDQADRLDLTANISQLISLFLLLKDASNNELMDALNQQNEKYLKKIIEQNEEILKLLKPNKIYSYKGENIDVLTYLEGKIKHDLQDVKATR